MDRFATLATLGLALAALGCQGAVTTPSASTASGTQTPGGTTPPSTPGPSPTMPTSPAPVSSGDPAFYTTPTVAGSGVRTINLTPGGSTTLQQAFDAAQPGDTIVLAAGTYTQSGGNLVLATSGTAASWITIQGAAGSMPTIDLAQAGELTLGGSYVLLENVEIINGGGNNLHIAPVSASVQDVIVRGCKIHSLATGPGAAIKINRNNPINAGVSLVYLENNDLSQSIGNALVDAVGANQCVARGNDLHDNQPGYHGIFFKGGSSEILIEKNLVRGIRSNAAIQLGGVTGTTFFDPAHATVEGFDQMARDNLITDCDDACVQIEGCQHAHVHHNTIVSQTGFAIFRLNQGSSASGAASNDDDVDIQNNLIIATGGNPQYARDDGQSTNVHFGRQLWAGGLVNAGSPGPGVPSFPQAGDVVSAGTSGVVVNPSPTAITGMADALARFALVAGSPAKNAGVADPLVGFDITGAARSTTSPSLGAFE